MSTFQVKRDHKELLERKVMMAKMEGQARREKSEIEDLLVTQDQRDLKDLRDPLEPKDQLD